MATVFSFPDVGEGIHEGKLVEWLVSKGQTVEEDQAIVKVETDKAVVELPAPESGQIVEIHVEEGSLIHVGDSLVTISSDGETAVVEDTGAAKTVAEEPSKENTTDEKAPIPGSSSPSSTEEMRKRIMRPPATPHTRALARELNVDLSSLKGSGPGGRITDEDVRGAGSGKIPGPKRAPSTASVKTTVTTSETVSEERIPMTHLRKVIADAMTDSKRRSAHVTHVDEADVTELYHHYKEVKESVKDRFDVRLTILPFFVKALVSALKEHPLVNSSVDEDSEEIILKKYYNVGIAVDTDEGLIVPVVKNADSKDIVTIAAEIDDMATRARNRTISLDDLKGGTCTITNMGALGGILATPIIHQPEVAILGMHAIKDRPVVRNGEIVIRKMMYLSLSFDHRIVDGAEAGRFMNHIVELISNPILLMTRL